ncbi:hypothetical protein [Paenibacillus ferrarius]|uniref:hypothetical protein n=1 Tax=Paenibacillus ferrarius TaxID=1469647 RepID=UPI003D2D08E4
MNEIRVLQWLGMVCLLAGVARMGMTPSAFIWGTDSPQELAFGLVASILMSVGTIVLYLVQSRETGRIGLVTALAISLGNIATVCMLWSTLQGAIPTEETGGIALIALRMLMLIGLTIGTVVFAILTYRARVFPRWVVALFALMLLSMVLPIEDNKYMAFFWGLTYVGMGYAICTGKLQRSKQGLA